MGVWNSIAGFFGGGSQATEYSPPETVGVLPAASYTNPELAASVARTASVVDNLYASVKSDWSSAKAEVDGHRAELRARTPADDFSSVALRPGTSTESEAMLQYRMGSPGRISTLEKALDSGLIPGFAKQTALDFLYDPGAGGRFLRNAGKLPLGLVDQVEVTKPGTLGEHLGAGAGTLTRGIRDTAALSYVLPTFVAGPGAGPAGKLLASATTGAEYGAGLANLETPWDAPLGERAMNAAVGAAGGAVFGAGATAVAPVVRKATTALGRPGNPTSSAALAGRAVSLKSKELSDPDTFYRVVSGREALDDILKTGKIRTNYASKNSANPLENRPVEYPSFSKGTPKVAAYADAKGPHYIIATQDETLQVSKLGRHGKGTTLFPTDADGNYMKELDGRAVDIYEVTPKGRYKLIYSKGRLLQI